MCKSQVRALGLSIVAMGRRPRLRVITVGVLTAAHVLALTPLLAFDFVEGVGRAGTAWAAQLRPDVRPNRTLPEVMAPDLEVRFDQVPTKEALRRARVLPEPLVAIGEPSPEDSAQLARALEAFARGGPEALDRLAALAAARPQSPWRASLLANVSALLWTRGYFTRAAAGWREAWLLSRDATDPEGAALADYALGEWFKHAATFGQVASIERMLEELAGRDVRGVAGARVTQAREVLWALTNHHEMAVYSGSEALKALLTAQALDTPAARTYIDAHPPSHDGMSLTDLAAMASAVGQPVVRVFRRPLQDVPVPAIVHLRSDHYSTVLQRDGDTYLLRDSALGGMFRMTAEALADEATGYVLLPADTRVAAPWRAVDVGEANGIVGHCGIGMPEDDDQCEYCDLDDTDSAEGEPPRNRDPNHPENPPTDDNGTDTNANAGAPPGPCVGCPGAFRHPMAASLLLRDTPLFYQPPKGPSVTFTLRYNHRTQRAPQTTAYGNVGPMWTHDWQSYVQDNNFALIAPYDHQRVHLRGEGQEYFTAYDPPTYWRSRATLVKVTADPIRYERRLPNGTVEVFTLADRAATLPQRKVFLTQVIDPQGLTLTLTYDAQFRLVAVTDAIGQVTELLYEHPSYPSRLTKVRDPFNRTTALTYDGGGRLASITDAVGMVSRFSYGTGDFVSSMTTPYGTSTFRRELSVNGTRSIEISDPMGGTRRTEFHYTAAALGATAPANEVPTGHGTWNAELNKYVSVSWSARAWSLHPGDVSQATVRTWLRRPNMAYGHALSRAIPHSEKRPLERRVWFRYPDQAPSNATSAGTGTRPSQVAVVRPDGSTQLRLTTYNAKGRVAAHTDALGRQTTYLYAANDVDLLEVRRVNGGSTELLGSFSGYTAQRRPTTVTDAAGQTTTFTYNAAGQPLTLTNALNETTTLVYGTNGYVQTVTGAVAGSTTTLTHDGYGRVRTVTEPDGYSVTLDYDALNRMTKVTYPDGTYEEAVYDRLGVGQVRDRLGRLTRYTYDSAKRLTSVTDAENRVVQLDWCSCGSLNALIDAKGQRTSWERDVEGRVTREVRADGTTDAHYTYDANGRLATVTDPLDQVTTYTYAVDGLVTQVAYSHTVHPTSALSFVYDPAHRRLTSMTDGLGTTTVTYRPVGQSGALAVNSIDGPLANDTVTYGYDALGRVAMRALPTTSWTIGYDALGRPTSVGHALGAFTWQYVGHTGRLLTQTLPNGVVSSYTYLGNAQDRRLQTIHHRTSGSTTLSKFDYTYDVVGNLVTWRQERSGQAAFQYTFTHDRVDQLTSAIKRSTDPTPVVLTRQVWSYDAAGNRSAAQSGDNVISSSFDALNRLSTRQPGGPLAFEGTVNEAATVTIDGRPASVDPSNTFRGTGQTTAGTTTVTVTARDGAGNTATQAYEVDVTGGSSAYTYDANGNLTSDGVKTYQWNARNELIRVQQGGADLATFTYDGFGRRVTKTAGGITHTYVYDGEDIVEERLSTGDVIRYIHGPGIDQVLARTTNGANPVYYLTDHLGSVVQEVDATQAVTLNREYDPWGVPAQGGATSGFAFTGREWDAEIGLYFFRARYYSPDLGRWLSEDPIGMLGGVNAHAYVGNAPTRSIDPYGLCQEGPDLTTDQRRLEAQFNLANDLILLAAGILFDPVKIKLNTADDVARVAKHLDSLSPQQLQALREAMEGAGERIMEGKIKDLARLPEAEWAKIRHVLRDSNDAPVAVVHYWRSLVTGIGEFFKFK